MATASPPTFPSKEKEIVLNTVAPKKSDHAPPQNRRGEAALTAVAEAYCLAFPEAQRYTLVYASKDFHNCSHPFAYCIRKPQDSKLHPGKINLPGGHVEPGETPAECAVRELQEETNLVGTFPVLSGLLIPSSSNPHDQFIVYVYRVIASMSNLFEEVITLKIDSMQNNPDVLPNLPLLISLLHAQQQGWILWEGGFPVESAYDGRLSFVDRYPLPGLILGWKGLAEAREHRKKTNKEQP